MSKKNGSIWITGASSGIGKDTAIEFLKNNYCVAVSARRKDLLESLKQYSGNGEKEFISIELNIADSKAVQKTVDKINRMEPINRLINNAGITTFSPAIDNSFNEIKEVIDTNLSGSIYAIRSVLPGMIEQGHGTIINIISVAAEKVFTNSGVYSASKAGLLSYANVVREEVRKYNIRIINILPGATKTPIWPNEALEKYSERMMSPTDIAKLILQLYEINSTLVPEEITIRPIKGDIE